MVTPTPAEAVQYSHDIVWHRIGKALKLQSEDVTREPLPRRWIDLIRHLDEQERNEARPDYPKGTAGRRFKGPR
jgi:hypothetical protein